ncbi:protein translocase subunit SecF [Pleionea mediterranea]|uniref:Protein-export membrane protein SecF n=1 Tax=Pleionea mediterranea TaxID=523701 RepID=A0A316FQI1_9GAMM|nr:protein translocase subunit SecF [Pleionea mediterranea]PWK50924.1 protein translocase subunit secF [Pleionea mediterranea]
MNFNIPFLKFKNIAVIFSALLLIGSITSLATKGLNVGLDFSGGTMIQVKYDEPVEIQEIHKALDAKNIQGAVVQYFGSSSDVTIKLPNNIDIDNDKLDFVVLSALEAERSDVKKVRRAFLSAAVGDELKEDGSLALMTALFCIMVYVAIRFEWKFALGSVAALAHDVIIVAGFFSFTQVEFDLTVLAAILAVIGYSLNDTIVVYDRIRENFLKMRNGSSLEIMNRSLNQTLTRTLITSITTLLVLTALFVFGGELIHGFATALIVGVLIGTYSSIYVASAAALALGVKKEDLMPPEIDKEGADQDPLM